MREEYEQLELDTRKDLERAIERVTTDSIKEVGEMILLCGEAHSAVRNRHEAYGIAAERLAKIKKAVKSIDGDTAILLSTLPDINLSGIEAVSSICNSTLAAAAVLIEAAAEMQRVLRGLYAAENAATDDPTPMDEWMESAQFQDADPAVADGDNNTEDMEDE